MLVIRKCCFETNSSTSHSCIIMTEEQNKKWEEGLYYYSGCYSSFNDLPEDNKPVPGCLYTQDEVLEFYRLQGYEYDSSDYDDKESFIRETDDFIGYDEWHDDKYLEFDSETYTTPGGEKVIVECKFGWDG